MFLISLIGLVAGFAGSIVLAISFNRLLEALNLAATAHSATLEAQYTPRAPIAVFTGLDIHLRKGASSARIRTALGAGLLAVSFFCQLIALLMSADCIPKF